jgi:hypothetical protein
MYRVAFEFPINTEGVNRAFNPTGNDELFRKPKGRARPVTLNEPERPYAKFE